MAVTNFAKLTNEEKTIWSMDFWKAARNYQFLNKFTGTSQDSMIQRITELRKSEKGTRAVITLVADLLGDGIAGDRTLKGNEEAMKSYDQVIRLDQLRHANKNEGRLADQKSIVNFREQSRDKLAYWMADRMDQLAFLTMSNVSYALNTNGTARVGSDLPYLEFAADVAAGTQNRALQWDATNGIETSADGGFGTANIAAADTLKWEAIVEIKAYAKDNYIRPIRTSDGIDFYHMFVTPQAMATLKKDQTFREMVRDAGVRGPANPLFKGTDTIMVDGIAISEYRHVYHDATWGVPGVRTLFCGAQALAFADIGNAYWVEEDDDYENQVGISVGKMFGFLKPKFHSNFNGQTEDFGMLTIDFAE